MLIAILVIPTEAIDLAWDDEAQLVLDGQQRRC